MEDLLALDQAVFLQRRARLDDVDDDVGRDVAVDEGTDPDADDDADGLDDIVDNCPVDPNSSQFDTDADGVVGSLVTAGIDITGKTAIIQGTGGAARGAAVGLDAAGANVTNRSPASAKKWRPAMQLDGVITAIVTPFNDTGEVDYEAFGRLLEHQLDLPAASVDLGQGMRVEVLGCDVRQIEPVRATVGVAHPDQTQPAPVSAPATGVGPTPELGLRLDVQNLALEPVGGLIDAAFNNRGIIDATGPDDIFSNR